ncbi:AAA family ATPase [Devosia aurantiaca]|uniref:NadR/Ttd14 AAA domain-containing protein n=1 Tax=Devosia aurantiaca TaxID=2714858 RepID=A0A6M1SGH3_9HYPH|nr:AAA family ATPase [Devosia aurantiaca]NGP18567.1 hypothetical protein [Devosia aurantiaca]
MSRVPVIAVSGYPGAGKTTLTRNLAARYGVPALHYDDFETITSRRSAEIRDWMARGSDYDEIDLGNLVQAIDDARRTRPRFVILDTLLGRAHGATGSEIAFSMWIDTTPDIALARKLLHASGEVGDDPARALDFARWVTSYTTHYQGFISETYRLQTMRVRSRADLILPAFDQDSSFSQQLLPLRSAGFDQQ